MLDVQNLSCRRGGRRVFRDLSFRLAPGEALHIIGANGSGKSTLLRVLASLLPFDSGTLFWQSQNTADDMSTYRNRLHYIGHLDALKPELTGEEILAYWQALQPGTARNREDVFGTASFRSKPIRLLSAGQKRRLALSRLMLSDAPLWLLDEPTTALDTAGHDMLLRAIAQHRDKGGMVIAAVHQRLDVANAKTLAMPEVS